MRKFEPYLYLFSLGSFIALIGIGLWGLYQLQFIEFFPKLAHANLMFFGFLWSFVAGFLMTAVPKMTNSKSASHLEILIAVGLGLTQIVWCIGVYADISIWCYVVQNIFLVIFVSRRFYQTRRLPFDGFVFIPFAFFNGIIMPLLLTMAGSYSQFIYMFAGEAFVLNLIMGLGGRLIPLISRLPNALTPHDIATNHQVLSKLFLACLLNASFFLQFLGFYQLAILLRLLVCGYISVAYLRLFTRPLRYTVSGIALKTSTLMILLGYLVLLFKGQSFNVAGQHLIYIGGFCLMTIMIASRVMLAHANKSIEYETNSKLLLIVVVLILAASLFRYLAGFDVNSDWMQDSVYAMLTAISIWSFKFVKIWWSINAK